jgi:hypothetical protein
LRSDVFISGALALALLALALPASAAADPAAEAAARVFPAPAVLEQQVFELDAAEAAQVKKRAGTAPPSSRIVRYVARAAAAEEIVGYAYVDRHLVRTLEETLLIAVDPAGRIVRIEVVNFAEPPEYKPSPRWYKQMEGHTLTRELEIKRGIRTLAGATLSSRAATDAVRRALAEHEVLAARGGAVP